MAEYLNGNDIITGVATNLIEDAIKGAWDKTKKFFKDLKAQDEILFQTAYEEYLTNTAKKNSQIKTIIYRRAPKDLYSFYECVGVKYSGKTYDTCQITNLFDIGNKIIITGTGGIGKSILFKHLFLNTISVTEYIPILIELRSFNSIDTKEISVYDAIYKTLCDNGFELEREYFEYSLKEGAYVILLDGYDEVNRDRTDKVTSEVKSFASKYNDNKVFVSSRPTEEFIGWNDFCEVETMVLSKKQAVSLIKKIDFDDTVKNIFCSELEKKLYDMYRSFASNPLLLNIMLLTYQKHAVMPERLNEFYEEAFVTLFNAHDATKDSYVRDIRSGLGCEEFKFIFAYICFKSYFKEEFEFTETSLREHIQQAKDKAEKSELVIDDYLDDLVLSVCMLVKEGLVYRFSHRSFQEYFAAWYTCKLVDEVQKKLLISWIKESESVLHDAYFQMLYNLQSEKVNKIILSPIIKELEVLYEKYGFSTALLTKLFDGVRIEKVKGNQINTSIMVNDSYLVRGLLLNNKLNDAPRAEGTSEIERVVYEKVSDYFYKKKAKLHSVGYFVRFDELLTIISENELLELCHWVDDQMQFAFKVMRQCQNKEVSKKKRVSSILEEL